MDCKREWLFIPHKAISVTAPVPENMQFLYLYNMHEQFIQKTKVDYAAPLAGLGTRNVLLFVTVCPDGPFLPP